MFEYNEKLYYKLKARYNPETEDGTRYIATTEDEDSVVGYAMLEIPPTAQICFDEDCAGGFNSSPIPDEITGDAREKMEQKMNSLKYQYGMSHPTANYQYQLPHHHLTLSVCRCYTVFYYVCCL
ncbi:hypothetical protein OAN61_01055 [bacterium]|nr:hypothetical protein [bacterium]